LGRDRHSPPALREAWSGLATAWGGGIGASAKPSLLRFGGIAADLAATVSLLASGSSVAMASLAGFLVERSFALGIRAFARKRAPDPDARPFATVATVAQGLAVAAMMLGLRGGAIATAMAMGSPAWLALVFGIAAGWLARGLAKTCGLHGFDSAGQPDAMQWTRLAIGITAYTLLLRALCLVGVPAMPQEAYYWNYSIRLDFGYHDHPPLVAWLIAAGETLLGHGTAGARIASLVCGLVVIVFAYRLAMQLVDRRAALMAAALAAALPYFFFATGTMMTPDAPLAAAWAAALYFFHRALVGSQPSAWLGVGVAMGLGMLSKYTIALLAPAALLFCLVDRRARGWFLRPQPYLAVLAAVALFAPVIYWNSLHDWASFRFQAGDRFGAESRFSLHRLLLNMLVVATPLPFLALPLLFIKRWTEPVDGDVEPAHAEARNRLFVNCFLFVPMAVFAWSALRHLPRLNWTGPIWLVALPLLGWAIVHAGSLRMKGIGNAMHAAAAPVLAGLLAFYAVLDYYVVLGFPGIPYPKQTAPLLGWSGAARELDRISVEVTKKSGTVPVVVGMDAYQIASELSFYSVPPYFPASAPRSWPVTSIGRLFGGEGLMFAYWNPPAQLRGRTLVMVARHREDLLEPGLSAYFAELSAEIHEFPLVHAGYGGEPKTIDRLFYRIGLNYRPPAGA